MSILIKEEEDNGIHNNSSVIPTLDLYQATYLSADWTLPKDARHYRPELNRTMLQWFYQ